MPTAGDEGYETLVQCPYDKAHEIRKGRMQFHLEKCRRNFPESQLVDCLYNKAHKVPKQELEYHIQEECEARSAWERYTHVTSTVHCPVKDLVPVNAGTVSDGGENWDNFEATGSVLNHIKAEAEQRPIIRMMQVASKAKRKAFRKQEVSRHSALRKEGYLGKLPEDKIPETVPVVSNQPLPQPRKLTNVSVVKQDPTKAVAAINKQFKSLDIDMKDHIANTASSSSIMNSQPSEFEAASTSRKIPFSYAKAAQSGEASRSSSAMSHLSTRDSTSSMMTALTSHRTPTNSRPSTAMSSETSINSYTTASQSGMANRPSSPISNSSMGSTTISSMGAFTNQRPPNSTTYRQSTAMKIAASVGLHNRVTSDEEGFCQIPIPGLGRGRKPVQ